MHVENVEQDHQALASGVMLSQPVDELIRVATLGFVPPQPVNRLSSLRVVETDPTSGEQDVLDLLGQEETQRARDLRYAFRILALQELAGRLNVDEGTAPWVPSEDLVLGAVTLITQGRLFSLLVNDGDEELSVQPHPGNVPPNRVGTLYSLPEMFTSVAMAMMKVRSGEGVEDRYAAGSAQASLTATLAEQAQQPLLAVGELFGTGELSPEDFGELRLSMECGPHRDDAVILPVIRELNVAVAFAWVANLVSSIAEAQDEAITFWLSSPDGTVVGSQLSLPMRRIGQSTELDLAISDDIGVEELRQLDTCLGELVARYNIGQTMN